MSDRDWLLRIKLMLPERIWRIATRPIAHMLKFVPEKLKYQIGLKSRAKRKPYSLICDGDIVFQIGVPSDLLKAGRSRAAYFLNLVSSTGKLVIMEPDSENCKLFEEYAKRSGFMEKLIIINAGGWSKSKELIFYQSKKHPASAVLAELIDVSKDVMVRRGYEPISVPVTSVDSVIKQNKLPLPKLVSITTNGAEIQILDGMAETIANGGPKYVSLAITGDGYADEMKKYGYKYLTDDDRGFTFEKI